MNLLFFLSRHNINQVWKRNNRSEMNIRLIFLIGTSFAFSVSTVSLALSIASRRLVLGLCERLKRAR